MKPHGLLISVAYYLRVYPWLIACENFPLDWAGAAFRVIESQDHSLLIFGDKPLWFISESLLMRT